MRKSETSSSGDINVTEEGREKVLQTLEQKFPCSPLERTVVREAALLQPMELRGGAEIYMQSMEDPMLKHVDMSGGRCSLRRNCAGADFLAGVE